MPLEEYLRRDTFPVPATADREMYHGDRHFDWWLSGLNDYLDMNNLLESRGDPLRPGDSVLDFGSASGRTLRHFAAQGDDLDLWCYDANRRHIAYCQRYLGDRVRPIFGTLLPHLPIADNSMKLVYAFSVFTHIDEFESAWLAEIRRVLRPGGYAYLTICSDLSWEHMNPTFPVFGALMEIRDLMPEYGINPDMFRAPMPKQRIVYYMGRGPNTGCNVFHSHEYIRDVWGRFLSPITFVEDPMVPQAGVLLQKLR